MKQWNRWLMVAGVGLAAAGCNTSSTTMEAAETYARIAEAAYGDSHAQATRLDAEIEAFLAAPGVSSLESVRSVWREAREPYGQTEVFRFYDGPIDHPETGPEGLINAWPLDEGYIDYVAGNDTAGIVNDPSTELSAETIEALNEEGGEENVATGYHAIEFLLWGQDLSETGAGDRAHTDFVSAPNADRRGDYLRIVSGMLVGHVGSVHTEWMDGATNYRSTFLALDENEALQRMLAGMIVLSGFELAGERIQTALDSGDQEDEHSCFSDNTHRDMVLNAKGVQNVWHGSYTRVDGSVVEGTGIKDVVATKDAALAEELSTIIDRSVSLAEALQPPFDREISAGNTEGNARVQALIDSLREQEELLFDVFSAFGLTVTIPE